VVKEDSGVNSPNCNRVRGSGGVFASRGTRPKGQDGWLWVMEVLSYSGGPTGTSSLVPALFNNAVAYNGPPEGLLYERMAKAALGK